MKREDLIKKWLDNELNVQELEAFKQLEDYDDLVQLSNSVMQFKAPEYNTSEELNAALQHINSKQRSKNWLRPVLRIAAILALSFSVYYYTTTLDTNISTLAAQKTEIQLPDASQVLLNASSTLTYNRSDWETNRDVTLEGEAFFKVTKGSKFSVNTSTGTVTVLGTQFNIKQRNNYFEVICYEGSVKVTHNTNIVILKPGNSFLLIDGEIIAKEKETASNPSWINNESSFKSMPFAYVIREFERQYNVTINTQDIDLKQLFTGSFVHNDKELALKSITLPLNLNYSLQNNKAIVLSRE
ncbi:Putative anti-sigma factor [hydrothermal vent metagenome]|jgi:transmembrane sensor|uniref:Anti-sigma factor n=1 Tax=hydrothermal vent metagenome TaxID=652676 RepID=A0A3B0R8H1_9ZZZZ